MTNVKKLNSFYVPHEAVDVFFGDEPSRTRQEFAEECDINVLMSKFERTGVINHFSPITPQYLDLGDGVPDLQSALNVVKAAETAFMSLPATVRREFDNDAVKFVAFAEDKANLDKLREWGLAPPAPVEPPPQRVEVVNPQSPAAPAGGGAA